MHLGNKCDVTKGPLILRGSAFRAGGTTLPPRCKCVIVPPPRVAKGSIRHHFQQDAKTDVFVAGRKQMVKQRLLVPSLCISCSVAACMHWVEYWALKNSLTFQNYQRRQTLKLPQREASPPAEHTNLFTSLCCVCVPEHVSCGRRNKSHLCSFSSSPRAEVTPGYGGIVPPRCPHKALCVHARGRVWHVPQILVLACRTPTAARQREGLLRPADGLWISAGRVVYPELASSPSCCVHYCRQNKKKKQKKLDSFQASFLMLMQRG